MKHLVKAGRFRSAVRPPVIPPKFVAVASPAPVMQYCAKPESDGIGICARLFFVEAGTVSALTIVVDSLKSDDNAMMRLRPLGAGASEQFEVKAGVNRVGEFVVKAGERLVLEVIGPQVDGVWVGFNYKADNQRSNGPNGNTPAK